MTHLNGNNASCPEPQKKPDGHYCNNFGITCKDGVSLQPGGGGGGRGDDSLTHLTDNNASCPEPRKKADGHYCNNFGFICKDGVSSQ